LVGRRVYYTERLMIPDEKRDCKVILQRQHQLNDFCTLEQPSCNLLRIEVNVMNWFFALLKLPLTSPACHRTRWHPGNFPMIKWLRTRRS
jgi:hypothetical protein